MSCRPCHYRSSPEYNGYEWDQLWLLLNFISETVVQLTTLTPLAARSGDWKVLKICINSCVRKQKDWDNFLRKKQLFKTTECLKRQKKPTHDYFTMRIRLGVLLLRWTGNTNNAVNISLYPPLPPQVITPTAFSPFRHWLCQFTVDLKLWHSRK